MSEYTQKLNDELWEKLNEYDCTYSDDYSSLLAFLNSKDFRTFGDGLTSVIKSKMPSDISDSPMHFLQTAYKSKGISAPSVNTLKSWFNAGVRPKKSEDSRNKMFEIAFALDLNIEETVYLFHNVYLDRAFDYRNAKEIIYAYCIERRLSYLHAIDLIEQMSISSTNDDDVLYTKVLEEQVSKIDTDNELIEYLNSHQNNLSKKNIRGKELKAIWLKHAQKIAKKETHESSWRDFCRGKDKESINFLISVITAHTTNTHSGTTTIFKNAELPKEIKNCFPEAVTFSKPDPTYEELRKMLILLFSYVFWYHVQYDEAETDIDDYISQLNDLLTDVGMPLLYAGNPFDWLFMYCTLYDSNPLDCFRGLLSEVLDEPF